MRGVPQRSIKRDQRSECVFPPSLVAECFREPGLLTASEMEPRQPPACAQLFRETASAAPETALGSGDGELAFLGDPFEGFGRTFDAVLAVVTVGRKQPDHLVGATGGRSGNVTGSKIDSLSNGVLMLQRPLH